MSFFSKRNKQFSLFAIALMLLVSVFPAFSYAQQAGSNTSVTSKSNGSYNANGNYVESSNTVTTTGANGQSKSVTTNDATGQSSTAYSQGAQTGQTTQSGNVNISGGATGSIGSCVGSIAAGYVKRYIASFSSTETDSQHVSDKNPDNMANGTDPSTVTGWNAIAYCVINGLLTYVTNSIVAWVNGGFNGNPAFIQNPGAYFQGIADKEAGTFINTLAKDTTGLNICQPLALNVGTSLLNQYGQGNPLTCSLGLIKNGQGNSLMSNLSNPNNYRVTVGGGGGYSNFNNGQTLNNFYGISQNPQNNAYGAYLGAQQQLAATIAQQQNTAQLNLNWGHGFQSSQSCPPQQTVVNQQGVSTSQTLPCQTTTPGYVIATQLTNTLNLGNERLVLAEKFDQVVSALVGTLIKLALNKVLSNSSH